MFISQNYIDNLIDTYYSEYKGIVPLSYQRNYIHNAITYFLKRLDSSLKLKVKDYEQNSILESFCVKDYSDKEYSQKNVVKDYGYDRSYNNYSEYIHYEGYKNDRDGRSNQFVVNLDVGLGKTITSIIISRILREIYSNIFEQEKKVFLEKINDEINGFEENSFEIVLLEELKNRILSYDKEILIGVIARKNLCLEFNEFFQDASYVRHFPSGRKIDSTPLNLDFGESFILMYQYNHNLDLSLNKFPFEIFIVDEYGSDPVFFGNGKYNEYIQTVSSNVIGLTANQSIQSVKNISDLNIEAGPRLLKTDEEIREELVKKHLYSGNSEFTYKFVDVRGEDLSKEIDEFKKIQEKSLELFNSNLVDLTNFKSELQGVLNTIFEEDEEGNVKKQNVDEIIKLIKKYKDNSQILELFNRQDELLKTSEAQLKDFQQKIDEAVYQNFNDIFTHSHLTYILEGNSIIVVDSKFKSEYIKSLKDFLKESEVKIYNSENFRNMEGTGNVLVGTVSELAKGLNLQHFDNILFSYIDEISVNDIYQGIGRLDRIGNSSDKEIILMSYNMTEDKINKIVEKKDEFNKGIPLKTIQTTGTLSNPELLKSITSSISENRQNYTTVTTNLSDLLLPSDEKTKEEKMRIEMKMKFVKENKKMFQDMISQIDKRFENTQKTISGLMGGSEVEMDTQYISSILTLF